MAHEDQFTATGPAFTGSGFPRTGFSTNRETTDFIYGANVEGSRCGVVGKSTKEKGSSRESDIEGVGVFGRGDTFGVYGQGNLGIAGVLGTQNNIHRPDHDGVGVMGAVMRGGTGVVGLSLNSIGNPANLLQISGSADGEGIGVLGSSGTGTGARGESVDGNGVLGHSQNNDGVVGESDIDGKSGVFGFNRSTFGAAFGVTGATKSPNGAGVFGFADNGEEARGGVGVRGDSQGNDGVVGQSQANGKSGVFGFNSKTEGVAFGVVGRCDSSQGVGVAGGNSSIGGTGVQGICDGFGGVGVLAQTARSGIALFAHDKDGSGLAGFFVGDVRVTGNQIIFGTKSAAVPHPDGSHRLLYCMESPESWFEDFGEARLVDGKAEVLLDPDFAAVIKSNKYHVFVTPYGNSNGLYVTHRNSKGFRVQEQNDGSSKLTFSYRVVAKRKDIKAERLAKITVPEHQISKVPKQPRKLVGKRRLTSDSSSYHKPPVKS
ncbi:MAG TPA: hypothetical protein VJ464_19270 [Blastocatellia bacterium]|nr:hypothetical protein [Blastocatellia bacterium]